MWGVWEEREEGGGSVGRKGRVGSVERKGRGGSVGRKVSVGSMGRKREIFIGNCLGVKGVRKVF